MLDFPEVKSLKGPADPPDRSRSWSVPDRSTAADDETTAGGQGRWLRCRFCGLIITAPSARTSPNGRHRHTFANPHGYVFDVRCFASAPGALPVGSFSADFSWFAGYSWQVVVGGRCQVHLGWLFQGGGGGFFALIGNRLRSDNAD